MQKYQYKNSEIEWLGNVPSHWKVDRIKDKTITVAGGDWGNDPDSDAEGDNIIVLRVADLDGIYFKFEDLTVRKIKKSSYKSRMISEKCLIIEKSGGGEKQLVGRVGFPLGIDFEAICSNFMAKIEFDNTVNLKYANYLFSTLYSSNLNFPFVQQTTGIQNLNVTYYLNSVAVFPPFLEQNKIANYLDLACTRMDRIIAIKEEQLKKIEDFYNEKITECTTRGLNKNVEFKTIESKWLKSIPKHWEIKKVKRVCKVFRGKFSHRPRNDPKFYDGEYPFIQTGSISKANKYITKYTQTLNELGLSVSELFPSGTLTMTIAANIGDVAILTFDACFPDSIVGFKPNHKVELDFLYYIFKGVKQDFLSTAIVTTQMNLNITRIGEVTLFIPPIEEQKEIVIYLENLSKMTTDLKKKVKKQIQTLTDYRKSLIHECVTGKKQVSDIILEKSTKKANA